MWPWASRGWELELELEPTLSHLLWGGLGPALTLTCYMHIKLSTLSVGFPRAPLMGFLMGFLISPQSPVLPRQASNPKLPDALSAGGIGAS